MGKCMALLMHLNCCNFRPTGPFGIPVFVLGASFMGLYALLLVRRRHSVKICTSGPAKNMHFWSGEKYALLVQ
jgi:hypothetical protein